MVLDPEVTAVVWNEQLRDAAQALVQDRVTQYVAECGG
jgi:hypothetical protein